MGKIKNWFGKAKLGTGKRFQNCVEKMEKEGKSEESAKKICASIGFKKYGKKRMLARAKKAREKK